MEKLRTGIIGCGKVGDFHAKVYAELPQSEFVAVCDADSARAEAFASRYGVKAYSFPFRQGRRFNIHAAGSTDKFLHIRFHV